MANGAVSWSVPTGSTSSGYYNWSSPAALNGFAYVGIASRCDMPLVQGKLLRVNLATHQIANVWKVVADGQLGGTIWTSPVVDAGRNAVFVTTGNRAYDSTGDSQRYAEALVSVDATTLAIKGSWSLPLSDPTPDADWGTSPTLFTDSQGSDLVSAANKNGILYAFRRDDVSAGPVWTRRLADAATGSDPAAGGVYSNGYFDGQRLYYAGGQTTIAGKTAAGAVRALDPRTGAVIWERAMPSRTYGALTGANGMLVVPSRTALPGLRPGDRSNPLREQAEPLRRRKSRQRTPVHRGPRWCRARLRLPVVPRGAHHRHRRTHRRMPVQDSELAIGRLVARQPDRDHSPRPRRPGGVTPLPGRLLRRPSTPEIHA